jgi:RHS repeat-associated protein
MGGYSFTAPANGEPWSGRDIYQGNELSTGAVTSTGRDLVLSAPGFSWPVVRVYHDAGDKPASAVGEDQLLGRGWNLTGQQRLFFIDHLFNDQLDLLYVVEPGNGYTAFQRNGATSNTFQAIGGARGIAVVSVSNGSEIVSVYDATGVRVDFFGRIAPTSGSKWRLWRITDTAGNAAYVGDPGGNHSDAATAGYDSAGRLLRAFDSAGRRYDYTYSTFDSVTRLIKVDARILTSGSDWDSTSGTQIVARVEYDYYSTGQPEDHVEGGDPGMLKAVRVTRPLTDASAQLDNSADRKQIVTSHYRYFLTGETYDAESNPGLPGFLRTVVEPEGARRFELTNSESVLEGSDSAVAAYATKRFEYFSGGRVRAITSVGSDANDGEANGRSTFTYEQKAQGPTEISTFVYSSAWDSRATVVRPDGTAMVQYFDQWMQPVSRVILGQDPAIGTSGAWVTHVLRVARGHVSHIASPANANVYDHAQWSLTRHTAQGRIDLYARTTSTATPGDIIGLGFVIGTQGGVTYTRGTDYLTESMTIGGATLSRSFVSAERRYPVASSQYATGGMVVEFDHEFYDGAASLIPSQVSTILPAVLTTENGDNTPGIATLYYNRDGTASFAQDEAGLISYTGYEDGIPVVSIVDADITRTGSGQDFAGVTIPSGLTNLGTPQHLKTVTYVDAQGRPRYVVDPAGRTSESYYTSLSDGSMIVLAVPIVGSSGGSLAWTGAVSVTKLGSEQAPECTATLAFTNGWTTTPISQWIAGNQSNFVAALNTSVGALKGVSASELDTTGRFLLGTRDYFLLPSGGSWPGTDGTHYDRTKFSYDSMSRVRRIESADGTVVRVRRNSFGNPTERYVGTNDNDGGLFPDSDRSSSGASNMTLVETIEWDAGAAGGNGLITRSITDVDGDWSSGSAGDRREIQFGYDARGRRVLRSGPVSTPPVPSVLRAFDNLDRLIATATYTGSTTLNPASDSPTTSTTGRLSLDQKFFDARGRAYRTVDSAINASNGQVVDEIESLQWFGLRSEVLKVSAAQVMKFEYDRHGRRVRSFVLASDNDTAYAHAASVSDDVVLSESQTAYDTVRGLPLMQTSIARLHNDLGSGSSTGPLDLDGDGDLLNLRAQDVRGRASITAFWYDDLDRPVDEVAYGTNSATGHCGGLNRGSLSSPPTGSADELRSTAYFAGDGTVAYASDPKGAVTRTFRDDAGRAIGAVSNYKSSHPTTGAADENHYVYADYERGNIKRIWVDVDRNGVRGSGDQVTTYHYGTTKGGGFPNSQIASGSLLREVEYPDSVPSTDDVCRFAYNALGEPVWVRDQAGNEITSSYDGAGRPVQRSVATLASGFDGRVRAVKSAYNDRGLLASVTQYSAADAQSGSDLDGVEYTHDHWGNITEMRQDRDSAVGSSGSAAAYSVAYSYTLAGGGSSGGRRTVRVASMTMPSGRVLTYEYLSSTSQRGARHDDTMSRVTAIKIGASIGSGTRIAEYQYAGVATPVGRFAFLDGASEELSSVAYDRTQPGTYSAIDRFGRIARDGWARGDYTDTTPDLVHSVVNDFDRYSAVVTSEDEVTPDSSRSFAMDMLGRLTATKRGELSSGAIPDPIAEETWEISRLGNWDEYAKTADGYTDVVESTFNTANELLNQAKDLYDRNGNMVDDLVFSYKYDAFGSLREIWTQGSGAHKIAEFRYNGLGHRISEWRSGSGSGTWTHFAYDLSWRQVAVYRGDDTSPKEEFVYHHAGLSGVGGSSGVDEILFRDRDLTNGETGAAAGAFTERSYYVQNWRGDVVALLDGYGQMLERVEYSGYGVPRAIPWFSVDFNGDGGVDGGDVEAFEIAWSNADSRCDVNRDGGIDGGDVETFINLWEEGTLIPANGLTTVFGNRRGFAGYEIDAATVGSGMTLYHVRNRVYHATLGRWLQRDPLGYIDGANLYQYSQSDPINRTDPFGLSSGEGPGGPGAPPTGAPGTPSDQWKSGDPNAAPKDQMYPEPPDAILEVLRRIGIMAKKIALGTQSEAQLSNMRREWRGWWWRVYQWLSLQQPARIPPGWSRQRYIDQQADMMSEAFDKAAEFAHQRFVQSGSGAFFGTLWKEIGNALTDPHVILDGVGMIPGLGEPADLLNAGLYAAEGNYAMAGLSAAAAVPILGYAANAMKTVKRLEKGVEAGVDAIGAVVRGPAGSFAEFAVGRTFKDGEEARRAWNAYQRGAGAEAGIVIGHADDPIKLAFDGRQAFRMRSDTYTENINRAWIEGAVDAGRKVIVATPLERIRRKSVTWSEIQWATSRGGNLVGP